MSGPTEAGVLAATGAQSASRRDRVRAATAQEIKQTARRIAQSFAGNRKVVDKITVSGRGTSMGTKPSSTEKPMTEKPPATQPPVSLLARCSPRFACIG